MRCVSPFVRRYLDIMGMEHSQECPCGKCIACLHNSQDMWSIRIGETCKAYRSFIYDTLTFNDNSLSKLDYTDFITPSDFMSFPDDVRKLVYRYSVVDNDTGEYRIQVPVIDKKQIQGWLKRGRELFFLSHGYRPKIKYFIVEEYGPKTSRPHLHLLLWGLSREDYITFFAKPWRRDFGFTKTKFIIPNFSTSKDRDCIVRYISKYVSKGVFESPLVKVGLCPKPFRCISHGIGEEYLLNKCFDIFRTWKADLLKGVAIPKKGHTGEFSTTQQLRYFHNNDVLEGLEIDFSKCGWHITTYYDSGGYAHALPRYYKHKLCNYHRPNLLSYALQSYLLESARVHYNKKIQAFASKLGYRIFGRSPEDKNAGFTRKLYNFLTHEFTLASSLQAKTEARGCFIKLKNHYGRAMNLQCAFAC